MTRSSLLTTLSRRSHIVCAFIAVIMLVIAVGYVALALLDREAAKRLWWAYAMVEVVLAVWNMAVYYAKAHARAERRAQRERHVH